MSYLELFTSQTNVFGGVQKTFEDSKYVVFGVPFDSASSYRTGARFAPNAIRHASQNIETYSFRSGIDLEDVSLHDAGDLNVSLETAKTVDMTKLVVEDIVATGKMPLALGGDTQLLLAS